MNDKFELSESDLLIGFAKSPPIYFEEAHTDNKHTSGVWAHFNIIRRVETQSQVEDWYKCTIPGCSSPFQKCSVANGNAKLRRHINCHQNTKPYTLTSSVLSEMLAAVSGLGKKYGEIRAEVFQQLMPLSSVESWPNFVERVEQKLNGQIVAPMVEPLPLLRSTQSQENLSPLKQDHSESSSSSASASASANSNTIQLAISLTDSVAQISLKSKGVRDQLTI